MVSEYQDVEVPENFEKNYLEMDDGTKLRHLYYRPSNPIGTVVLYPGMNTLLLSWINVITRLSEENFRIEYIESREKFTAILNEKKSLDKELMFNDCEDAINHLNLDSDYIALGSSLGSTTLIHCLAKRTIKPKLVILVGPNLKFKVPIAFKLLLPFINSWSYRNIGKKIMQKVVLKKYTNEEADPEQKHKYMLALEIAEPIRLKKTLRYWNGYTILPDLPNIDGSVSKCYLIGASEDKLHHADETKLIADKIENAEYVDLKTNKAAHTEPIISMIVNLVKP